MKDTVKYIKCISTLIDTKMSILLNGIDLTPQQMRVLDFLTRKEGEYNQKLLCEIFKITPATMNGILDRLEHKGYIIREKSNDKRNNIIKLTDKAYEVNQTFIKAVKYNDSVMSKGITEEELVNLKGTLLKMIKNMEEAEYDKNFSKIG